MHSDHDEASVEREPKDLNTNNLPIRLYLDSTFLRLESPESIRTFNKLINVLAKRMNNNNERKQ